MMVAGEGSLGPSLGAGSGAGRARREGAYSCVVVTGRAPVVVLVL